MFSWLTFKKLFNFSHFIYCCYFAIIKKLIYLFLVPLYYSIAGTAKDGFSYVLHINGGYPPWSLLYPFHCFCQIITRLTLCFPQLLFTDFLSFYVSLSKLNICKWTKKFLYTTAALLSRFLPICTHKTTSHHLATCWLLFWNLVLIF